MARFELNSVYLRQAFRLLTAGRNQVSVDVVDGSGALLYALSTTDTIAIPTGYTLMGAYLIGAGGGGGSGRRGPAAGGLAFGGSAGAGGGASWTVSLVRDLIAYGDTITVQLPPGGGGGSSQGTDNTNGISGGQGAPAVLIIGATQLIRSCGLTGRGLGGTAGPLGTTPPAGGAPSIAMWQGGDGGASGLIGDTGHAAAGGGGGGQLTDAGVPSAGADGGFPAAGASLAAGGAVDNNGASGVAVSYVPGMGGGGGGGGTPGTHGGNGGAGAFPGGGGGGGGASANGIDSGRGGDGGNSAAILVFL